MFRYRFKLALRSLLRNKSYSIINVLGLAIGLGVSIILFLYLSNEFSYDKHIPHHEHIYRISTEVTVNNNKVTYAGAGYGMIPLLKKEYPFIENGTRLYHIDENILFKKDELKISDNKVGIADADFFRVFKIPFIRGNPETALEKPQSLVVTRSFAKKYFGDDDPVGKFISTNNYQYTITGLIEDFPDNTHHSFSALISSYYDSASTEDLKKSLWRIDAHSFLYFNKPEDAERLLASFPDFYDKYMAEAGEELNGFIDIKLNPLDNIHYSSPLMFDRPSGDYAYLYAFGAIGLLILILACINYVNMATIRSLKNITKAGMQKILGAGKREVIIQILIESLLLAFAALFISLVLVELVLEFTYFNHIIGKNLALDFTRFPELWWLPISLALLIAFLSGWYPAVYLSRVPPLAVVKKGAFDKSSGLKTRKALVGFQFTISVAVVITALLMYRQMQFVKNKDMGFNKEDIILVPLQDTVTISNVPKIQKQLAKSAYVISSSTSHSIPGKRVDRTVIQVENENGENIQQVVDFMMVGLDYLKTMEIEILKGREFRPADFREDEYPIIINQSAAAIIGGEDPIGKKLEIMAPANEANYKARVIGVVQDFNAQSLHEKIEPAIITLQEENSGYLYLRINSDYISEALTDIENALAEVRPDNPFQFSFLNADLMQLYEEEQKQSRLILILTYLAIFISFLGLTGLASFTTNLRTREIGIRKILGANIRQMVGLMFYEMLALIVISVLIAMPLAFFLIKGWLHNFAFTTALDLRIFIFSGLLAVILAYIIISYHSYRVARTKPVETLRGE